MAEKTPPKKLLWIDLEMTGLDPSKDVILEIAALVTDWGFNELGSFDAVVGHDVETTRERMDGNDWWATQITARDDILALVEKAKPEVDVQQDLLAFINTHFESEPVLLAGNSIHQDRRFIRKHWPMIDARLHYRMLDVSAWKVVMEGKYGLSFDKASVHRAMDDIRESIAELKFYLDRSHF